MYDGEMLLIASFVVGFVISTLYCFVVLRVLLKVCERFACERCDVNESELDDDA